MSGLAGLEALRWGGDALAVAVGLVWGSFTNVLIHRLPEDRSVVRPRSRCPSCGATIAAYDNVPVLSYVLLRGRCRRCRTRISLRYPFVELAVAAGSLASYRRHGLGVDYVAELAFVVAIVALVWIDYDHQILPNKITYPGTLAGLVLAGPRSSLSFVDALAGALLGAGLLLVVAEAYLRVRGIEGLGMGDVKMMAMVGSFLGWKLVLLTLFFGSLVGSLVGLALLASRGGDLQAKLPFGTFLGVAALASLFAGEPLVAWYTALF